MIEEAVEEYRTTLEATLSHVVDNFVDNIRFSCSSQFDLGYLKHNINMRVSVGGDFNASRDTAKGCEDKQQEQYTAMGSCLEENTLVLVCGHPSVSSMNGSVLYFVATDEQGKVSIRSEWCNEVRDSIHVLIPAQAVDFILKTLKEVFK